MQLGKYQEMDYNDSDKSCCLSFWEKNKQARFEYALRALSVPASNAPVEHIFSHGDLPCPLTVAE